MALNVTLRQPSSSTSSYKTEPQSLFLGSLKVLSVLPVVQEGSGAKYFYSAVRDGDHQLGF